MLCRLFAAAAWLLLVAPPDQAPITVSAAVSLTDVLAALQAAYATAGGGPVRFNFGGSNMLARQIAAGAPVDLFISADDAQMDVAEKAGAIDRTTRVDLVGNRLAVVVPGARPNPPADARGLLQPQIRRIALGDPAGVPAGVYAQQYLRAIGLWDALQPRLIPVANVRAALSAAANGTVDAAIVYESDAGGPGEVRVAFVIAGPDAPRIVYPAAIVAGSRNRSAAERFLFFLRGSQAARIFAQFKFVPLASPALGRLGVITRALSTAS
jgi:molybdate transport system substrate-binding protein